MDWIEPLKLLSEVEEMKNKEKYAKEIIEIACKYGAVNERTGELKGCS